MFNPSRRIQKMSDIKKLNPLAVALGTTFAISLSASPIVNAADNPFSATQLSNGYMVADAHEGKCGEGKCGDKKKEEGKCGEGKCGDKKAEGSCGDKKEEGKCGEGKCGDKKKEEGKCGEGKCGDKK
jgi:uncharacterized low-complexity protein